MTHEPNDEDSRAAAASDRERRERVARLKLRVREGRYPVDADSVAARMMRAAGVLDEDALEADPPDDAVDTGDPGQKPLPGVRVVPR